MQKNEKVTHKFDSGIQKTPNSFLQRQSESLDSATKQVQKKKNKTSKEHTLTLLNQGQEWMSGLLKESTLDKLKREF